MRHQKPTAPNTLLYYEFPDGTREWTREVFSPDESPLWNECTDGEKAEWQAAHPEPEPQEEYTTEE